MAGCWGTADVTSPFNGHVGGGAAVVVVLLDVVDFGVSAAPWGVDEAQALKRRPARPVAASATQPSGRRTRVVRWSEAVIAGGQSYGCRVYKWWHLGSR
jgi:hypothetical protein